MVQEPIEKVADRLKGLVGAESQPYTNKVEEGAIIKFAEAIYADEVEGAAVIKTADATKAPPLLRQNPSGTIIAPPTFLRSMKSGSFKEDVSVPLDNVLDGGSDWEYFEPVRAGDSITVMTRLAGVNLRETRLGKMLFIVWEIRYVNQNGKVAAIQRATEIRY